MPTETAMKVSRKDLNPCTVQLEISCTEEQVNNGIAKAYKDFAKQIKVPGFRPGQAPRSVLEKMIPESDLLNQAVEYVVSGALKAAMLDEKLTPHDSPSVTLNKFDRASSVCEFVAKVPLAPIIDLGDYKSLTAERPKTEVTDSDVDEYLEELRQRSGKRESITDRGASDGDIAVVNVRLEGEAGDGRNFMTIVGKTFADLDQALHGMKAEEMKVLTLNFPANFQEKDWAGKKHKCQVTLRSINSVRLPELDDEFAQGIKGEFASLKSENLGALRAKLKERMELAQAEIAQEYINEGLQEELLRRSSVQVPDTMWEAVAAQRLREMDAEARQKGRTLEDVAKESGMTTEEMIAAWQQEAKIQVQRAVLAREIFVREKLQLTNQDLNMMLVQMAQEYEVTPEQLADVMKKNKNFQELEIRTIFKKVMEFLNAHATITEATGGKTSAKKSASEGESATKPKKTAKKKAD